MSDKELDQTIDEYQAQLNKCRSILSAQNNSVSFFARNVEGLTYMREQRYQEKLRKRFKLRKGHLQLLAAMKFKNFPDGGDLVFLGVDGKRPFGNVNIQLDIAKILGLHYDGDEGFGRHEAKVKKLMDELPIAIEFLINEKIKNDRRNQ